ncbi:hypothetical protein KY349_02000 [Candidatus Woesearchaeota archaeon]|nr:hypothetical protein [Candidatus Woesearchaeota archaeon]
MKNYFKHAFKAIKSFAVVSIAAAAVWYAGCAAVNPNSHVPEVVRHKVVHAAKAPKQNHAVSLAQIVKEQDKDPVQMPGFEDMSYTTRLYYCPAGGECNDLFITYNDRNTNNVIDAEDELILALHQDNPERSILVIKDNKMDGTADEGYIDMIDQGVRVPIDTDEKSRQEMNQFYNDVAETAARHDVVHVSSVASSARKGHR